MTKRPHAPFSIGAPAPRSPAPIGMARPDYPPGGVFLIGDAPRTRGLGEHTAPIRSPSLHTGMMMEGRTRRSTRRQGRGKRAAVVEPEAAESWELHGRVADIKASHESEKIKFNPLDPTDLHAQGSP